MLDTDSVVLWSKDQKIIRNRALTGPIFLAAALG